MARTKSEMRVALLSISSNKLRTSTKAPTLTKRRASRAGIKRPEQRLQHTRLDVPARQPGGQLPQIVLSMAAQQGIQLVFQFADGQRIGRRFIVLREVGLQLFDFRFLCGSQLAPPQIVARVLDAFQNIAQLACSAFRGGGGIVEFVSEARGKFSERRQAVALLFPARGFADSVGHHAHETFGQLRHLLHEVVKFRFGESQDVSVRQRASAERRCFHPGKRKLPSHLAGVDRNNHSLAAEFTPRLNLSVEEHKHRGGGITGGDERVTRLEAQFLRLADEPCDLVFRQVRENRDAFQFRILHHWTFRIL